nr:M23 family metallopeptidase [uncultured Sellimonas sp.]
MNAKRKLIGKMPVIFILLLVLDGAAIPKLINDAAFFSMDKNTKKSSMFREQQLTEELVRYMQKGKEPARESGIYLLEKNMRNHMMSPPFSEKKFLDLEQQWNKNPCYTDYKASCESIWSDVEYFPVMFSSTDDTLTVSYEDSWMNERTYGGKRGHEGTDIMASQNERGLYPVVSMTDGTVTSRGWLPKGGWRIGITSEHGGYFYYAHLDSYGDAKIGDKVEAGDIIGYMGDSGYGEKGTVGKFPVHLHLGIYLEEPGEEISINPYWILKYIENSKLKCSYS